MLFVRTFRTSAACSRFGRGRGLTPPNPFRSNVGLSGQMRDLDLDPDDAELINDIERNPERDPNDLLFDVWERTRKYERQIIPRAKPEHFVNREKLAKLITAKKYFPTPKDPILLTWMEIQTIKYLHESSPNEYTPKMLSECFPATEDIIKQVLRIKSRQMSRKKIAEHDKQVSNNWKMIASGKLPMSQAYSDHLEEQQLDGKDRLDSVLSSTARSNIEKEIWEKLEKEAKNTHLEPGEFGNIIVDYKSKVETKNVTVKVDDNNHNIVDETVDSVPVRNLFSEHSEYNPEEPVPNPYGETAILGAGVNFRNDGMMTSEEFKKKQLETDTMFATTISEEELQAVNPIKAQYVKWLKSEKGKNEAVTVPEKINVHEVLSGHSNGQTADEILRIPKYKRKDNGKKNKPKKAQEVQNVQLDLPEKKDYEKSIKISKQDFKKGALYQVNDSFYDDKGEFLYRVPKETM